MRSRRVFRLIWNCPPLLVPQMKVKPRKLKVSGFPSRATLTTSAIGPKQLAVVWTLILQSEPEGPALISCAARLHRVGCHSYMVASSLRRRGVTAVGITMQPGITTRHFLQRCDMVPFLELSST